MVAIEANELPYNSLIIGLAKKHLQELEKFLKVAKAQGMIHSKIVLQKEVKKLQNHVKELEKGAKNAIS